MQLVSSAVSGRQPATIRQVLGEGQQAESLVDSEEELTHGVTG
jgi:hypothetical protein